MCATCPKRQYKKNINHGFAPIQGKETKEQAFAKSEHILRTVNMIVQCSRCLSKLRFNYSADLFKFVRSLCNPAIKHDYHSSSMSITGQIRIGNQSSHPSHDMYSYKGIQYCNKCGYMVKRRMQNLIKPCNGSDRCSTHGQRVLESITRHELPPGVEAWPDPT